jgi:lipopolysaccharide export system protein LptA
MKPRAAAKLVPAVVGSAVLALTLVFASAVPAQTLNNTFGGLSESSDQPIDIESDVLVVHDAKKYATFKGNVKAVQGTTTLRAAELDVHYVGSSTDKLTGQGGTATPVANVAAPDAKQGAGDNPQTQIEKIEARGDVVITSKDDQTTTSEWAIYDVPSQLVTVGGNVVLTQGQNVLKGDRLIIDLKTGESRFENTGNTASGGRIRALFMPKQGGAAASTSEPADAEPASAEPASAEPQQISPAAVEGNEEPAPAATGDDTAASDQKPANDAPAAETKPWQIVPEFR